MLGGLASAVFVARWRAQTARGLAEDILANANREAQTIRRQADLEVKEEALARREALDTEADRVRHGLREQERRLEKR
jgi:ribonuclease Y